MEKIRTKLHNDGRIELIRILSPDDRWSAEDPLAYEASVVWCQEITALPYVREAIADGVKTRTGRLHGRGIGRIVGYAKLAEDAPRDVKSRGFRRRYFFIKEKDLDRARIPRRAVDPQTVFPGIAGKRIRSDKK